MLNLLFPLFLATPAHTAVLDVGPGQPYATISSALAAAVADDTVRVAPGNYDEYLDITTRVLLKSIGGSGSTFLTNSGGQARVVNVRARTVMRGFTIDAAGKQGTGHVGGAILDLRRPRRLRWRGGRWAWRRI